MTILNLIAFFLLITFGPTFAQKEEIYRLTFTDPTNFGIMNDLGNKKPKTILIVDSTDAWDYTIFWNGLVGGETQAQIDTELKATRHESYDPQYFLRDPEMLRAISTAERKSLRKRTLNFNAKKLKLQGTDYHTLVSSKKVEGFYVSTTEPVFTSDQHYAFIKLVIHLGESSKEDAWSDVFGNVTIVYQKQKGGKWERFKKFEHLIL